MPKQKGGARPGAGRRAGGKNRATIERELLAKQAIADAKASRKPLAKEVLADYMHGFTADAARCKKRGDLKRFREWAALAVECARALAPFESPRFSAVVIGATVVTKVVVEGGMPDDFAAAPIPLEPGTVVRADEATPVAGPEPEVLPLALPKVINAR